jgi:hypothetical protein
MKSAIIHTCIPSHRKLYFIAAVVISQSRSTRKKKQARKRWNEWPHGQQQKGREMSIKVDRQTATDKRVRDWPNDDYCY